MSKKKKIMLLTGCFSLILIQGCSFFPDGKSNSWGEVETGEVTTDADKYAVGQLSEKISINAKISIPEEMEWKKYNVQRKSFSEEEAESIRNLFMKNNMTYTDQRHVYSDTDTSYPGKTSYGWLFDDGSRMSCAPSGEIGYTGTRQLRWEYQSYLLSADGEVHEMAAKQDFPKEELADFPKETAIEMVLDLCRQMGVDMNHEPKEIYALDAENANRLKSQKAILRTDKTGNEIDKGDWTSEDEVYYLSFELVFQGCPLSCKSSGSDSGGVVSSGVTAIVSRSGIENLRISGLYEAVSQEVITEETCSLEDVYNIVASQYYYTDGITGDISVTEINMAYGPTYSVATKSYTIVPYWECVVLQTRETEKDGKTVVSASSRTMFIDPVTKILKFG